MYEDTNVSKKYVASIFRVDMSCVFVYPNDRIILLLAYLVKCPYIVNYFDPEDGVSMFPRNVGIYLHKSECMYVCCGITVFPWMV
jgi:hypothetical protein